MTQPSVILTREGRRDEFMFTRSTPRPNVSTGHPGFGPQAAILRSRAHCAVRARLTRGTYVESQSRCHDGTRRAQPHSFGRVVRGGRDPRGRQWRPQWKRVRAEFGKALAEWARDLNWSGSFVETTRSADACPSRARLVFSAWLSPRDPRSVSVQQARKRLGGGVCVAEISQKIQIRIANASSDALTVAYVGVRAHSIKLPN